MAAAERTIRDLYRQDRAGYTERGDGSARDVVARWRQAGSEAGDLALVAAIDLLGLDRAAEIYAECEVQS